MSDEEVVLESQENGDGIIELYTSPNLVELLSPGGPGGSGGISSINGKSGTSITLSASDVGALPSSYVPAWTVISGKPSSFPPSAHVHPIADISDATILGRQLVVAADAPTARSAIGAQVAGSYSTSADLAAASTYDRDRSHHSGTQTASTISDLSTAIQTIVDADGVTLIEDPNDPGTYLIVSRPSGGSSGLAADPTDIGTFDIVDATLVYADPTDDGTFLRDPSSLMIEDVALDPGTYLY